MDAIPRRLVIMVSHDNPYLGFCLQKPLQIIARKGCSHLKHKPNCLICFYHILRCLERESKITLNKISIVLLESNIYNIPPKLLKYHSKSLVEISEWNKVFFVKKT